MGIGLKHKIGLWVVLWMLSYPTFSQQVSPFEKEKYTEPYRPQIHFSPEAFWMNDPNGMVFFNDVFHLFYQYYPFGTVWGPMNWGHATSKDLIHWQNQPIAIKPDGLGYVFSGSAVADVNNTSGLGRSGQKPLVAIYTSHDPIGEKAGKDDYETQSLAYSLDDGATWKKFFKNPVLKNPGMKDFRDPKVMWYAEGDEWVMSLAVGDHIEFYSSPDLKAWTKLSDFGKGLGAHGGVWECPDLISFDDGGKKIWVLIVNLNPGGPNGGSGTQYFVGDFDGKTFRPFNNAVKWLDFGPDEYAGVTWSNTGNRKIFLGWMSNWSYADKVPTKNWRGAMTLPRELSLRKTGGDYFVSSLPVGEMNGIRNDSFDLKNGHIQGEISLSQGQPPHKSGYAISISLNDTKDFSFVFSNKKSEEITIGYEKSANEYYIDRTKSGQTDFSENFRKRVIAPRISTDAKMNLTIILDVASAEIFADDGLTTMTAIFFPEEPYDKLQIGQTDLSVEELKISRLNSIWR